MEIVWSHFPGSTLNVEMGGFVMIADTRPGWCDLYPRNTTNNNIQTLVLTAQASHAQDIACCDLCSGRLGRTPDLIPLTINACGIGDVSSMLE